MYNYPEGGGCYVHRARKALVDSLGPGCITVVATKNVGKRDEGMVGIALSPSSRAACDKE